MRFHPMRSFVLAAVFLLAATLLSACVKKPADSSSSIETALSSAESAASQESAASTESVPLPEGDLGSEKTLELFGGSYATAAGATLTIDLMDNNSFEFTVTSGEKSLETMVARTSDTPGEAVYISDDRSRLTFRRTDTGVTLTGDKDATFDGEYLPVK